ncbi:hypothetical protein CRG98_030978 [Punica granatum]|uniref:Integrase catalytic domain-containing protein n=1 Tax=Punica granatum TaxID=22663 RepID=A0A2I0IY66_PUNGR|nr:hypothetical protein CRG98_030978 [Punica granatum]
MRNIAKWRCQLTENDIEYVSRTSVKGQAIADNLAEFPIVDDTPIDSDFPDERILQMSGEEEITRWKMYFDGAVNSTGSGIGAVLISPEGHHFPVAAKIDFPCTNNIAEYEACILGLQAAIDLKVKELELSPLHRSLQKIVARFLKRDIIARYGVPATLVTDNAKNLNNKLIDELCAQFKILHRNSSPYRPQMNGAVEAANKNIKKIIEKMTVN